MTSGWYPEATRIEGVRTWSAGNSGRVGFCDHTAGGFYTTLTRASFWNAAGVSTHFAISRKGEVAQMVNIFDTAWAQGRLGPTQSWGPYQNMKQATGTGSPNAWLISTEHEDWQMVGGVARAVPGSEWTPEEYAADLAVKRWCVEECARAGFNALQFGPDSLTGHHMFDSVNRAECPGRFWRDDYHARLYADLTTPAPPAPRVWLYGNEMAGLEIVGKQQRIWNQGVNTDRLGMEDGSRVGTHLHNQGGEWVELAP